MGKKIDLTGQKFGRLTVLEEYPIRNHSGGVQWVCQCKCGKQVIVNSDNLRRGHTQSCGCQRRITAQKFVVDLTGKRFGKLTVIGKFEPPIRTDRHTYWACNCDCGTTNYIVDGENLKAGRTVTCGCGNRSQGELKIIELLQQNNIQFEEEKTFDSCRFPATQHKCRFDFYLSNYNILIEFDGAQHFQQTGWNWNSQEQFNLAIQHDKYKNQWCKEHQITLIRIPYYFLNSLKIEDLLPNSRFILT